MGGSWQAGGANGAELDGEMGWSGADAYFGGCVQTGFDNPSSKWRYFLFQAVWI